MTSVNGGLVLLASGSAVLLESVSFCFDARAKTIAGIWKQTLLPIPVGMMTRQCLLSRIRSIISFCRPRNWECPKISSRTSSGWDMVNFKMVQNESGSSLFNIGTHCTQRCCDFIPTSLLKNRRHGFFLFNLNALNRDI